MSNMATQVRAIALIAREVSPTAKTVRLESSDQGDWLTTSSPFVVDADGTEHDADDNQEDRLWLPTSSISCDEAGRSELPGWTVLNARGGYYEFDVDAVLKVVPSYSTSALAGALSDFEAAIKDLPSEPPIIMADVDEDDGRVLGVSLHCPRCGAEALHELDWDTRWNELSDPGFGEGPNNRDDLYVGVIQGDGEYQTLTWFCSGCGQVVDMDGIETVWS